MKFVRIENESIGFIEANCRSIYLRLLLWYNFVLLRSIAEYSSRFISNRINSLRYENLNC